MKRDFRNMVELKEILKNPSPKLKVPVYTQNDDEVKPVNKPKKKKYTLNQIGEIVVEIKNHLDKVDARLDYVIKANDLKDLPKSKQ